MSVRYKNMQEIDGTKLRNFILSKDLNLAEASRLIDASPNYINGACCKNLINPVHLKALCNELGVDKEYFLPKREPEPVPQASQTATIETGGSETTSEQIEILRNIEKNTQTIMEILLSIREIWRH